MWVLFFVIGSLAGSSVTTVAGFGNEKDCESARAQVEKKLSVRKSACVEMTQHIIGMPVPAPDAPVDHDH
jgi:hypothetical protein